MIVRLLCAISLLAAAHAQAAQLGLTGVIGSDDRKPQLSLEPPWNAVGKIQAAGYNWIESCTGTLIAPRLVLTAAHCLIDPRMKKPVPVSKLNFLAGLRRDKWLAHAKVACIKSLEPLTLRDASLDAMRSDVAVLVLSDALDIAPVPLASDAALVPGVKVDHGGYGKNRPFVPSVHQGCRVIAYDRGLVATDCDTTFGQSGGPVLVVDGAVAKIAAVMTGGLPDKASFGVAIENWRKLANDADCEVNSAAPQ